MERTTGDAPFSAKPIMTFSRDPVSGRYLSCNQAFAEYAHKSAPGQVEGLTDADLFDSDTALRLAEEDRTALSSTAPYAFYEEAEDGDGTVRHYQVTRLKFTDSDGRAYLPGTRTDISEMVLAKREAATSREAGRTFSTTR